VKEFVVEEVSSKAFESSRTKDGDALVPKDPGRRVGKALTFALRTDDSLCSVKQARMRRDGRGWKARQGKAEEEG